MLSDVFLMRFDLRAPGPTPPSDLYAAALDMARTTVNVVGDLTAAAFIARSEGAWEPSMAEGG